MSNYPHIENFYKNFEELVGQPVVIQEKIDGCNFSVKISKDKIEFCSKNQTLDENNPGMFGDAIALAKQIFLPNLALYEQIFFFEYFGKSIQKRINYDKLLDGCKFTLNEKSLALIDIYDATDNVWLVPTDVKYLAKASSIIYPKTVFRESFSKQDIEDIQNQRGDFADFQEGAVVKHATGATDKWGGRLWCKVKTNWYEEKEKTKVKVDKPKVEIPLDITEFVNNVINFGRLNSVYSHGHLDLKREMGDMKYLPKLVIEDIKSENDPIWSAHDAGLIEKTLIKQIPATLKKWLSENALNASS